MADNGIGMPAEFLERLFDPFECSGQKVVENIQGTGLGMSISKSLAEAMGGAISVESEVGRGSTFTLVLDLKIGDDAATAAIRDIPREDAKSARIIALTANAFAEDVQAALEVGMDVHVSKPIVLDELEQTLLRLP